MVLLLISLDLVTLKGSVILVALAIGGKGLGSWTSVFTIWLSMGVSDDMGGSKGWLVGMFSEGTSEAESVEALGFIGTSGV